ncbi:MAG: pilus assembly protein N-terminal domain-containing protein, partial [Planctomycetota bacterium]
MFFTYLLARFKPLARSPFAALLLLLSGVATAQDVPAPPEVMGQGSTPQATRLPGVGQAAPRDVAADDGLSRLQPGFPRELILPAPSWESKQKANRFIPTAIDPELSLKLVVGRPKILQLAAVPKRIYLPTDEVVRTEIIDEQSGKEVAVTGLQPGTTTLIFWFEDATAPGGQTTIAYEVRVYDDPLLARPTEDLQGELNEKFPNSYIELSEISDRLIVSGQVPDVLEMSQILNVLLGSRRTRGLGRNVETPRFATELNFSTTDERLEAERGAEFANRLIDFRALAAAGIINQLKVVGEQQVMLKVTVAEVNRDAARSIGLNFDALNDSGTVFSNTTGSLLQTGGASTANIQANLDVGNVQLAINALRTLNLSQTLAEPNLVTMNGVAANFQAGGQFPVPVISGAGGGGNNLQGVSFVPFGVQLQFTPLIQERDVIRLDIQAEVSTRDESLGATIGGGAGGGAGTGVAGLNSRNFSSSVQLRSGQTIAVAGLLQTNYGASTDRVPFWGDLPIIGTTGGVRRSSSGELELVILVTPHLVAPVDGCEGPALPGSDVYEPTDIEFYIANRLESRRSRDARTAVRTDRERQKRLERCCPENYMIGQVGPTDRCCPTLGRVPHRAVPTGPTAVTAQPTEQKMSDYFEGASHEQ